MLLTPEKLRSFIETDVTDEILEVKLQALENLIRNYTHNNFQNRGYRTTADIVGGFLYVEALCPFDAGDTVQISKSALNSGIYTVSSVDAYGCVFEVSRPLTDEKDVLVTKVSYPPDVVLGVVNMMKWELENREKVGIQSETISRHSVTYFNMDGDNSVMGFPKSLLGFLKPYMKARF